MLPLTATESMESLNTNQVCELLLKEGFDEEVVAVFKKNKINGKALLLLKDEDMKSLGLDAIGDRVTLQDLITRYRGAGATATPGGLPSDEVTGRARRPALGEDEVSSIT